MTLFPEPPERGGYSGMTVNERLYDAGLLEEFDDALRRGDRDQLIAILTRVELDAEQSAWTADTVLAHPTRYLPGKPAR